MATFEIRVKVDLDEINNVDTAREYLAELIQAAEVEWQASKVEVVEVGRLEALEIALDDAYGRGYRDGYESAVG